MTGVQTCALPISFVAERRKPAIIPAPIIPAPVTPLEETTNKAVSPTAGMPSAGTTNQEAADAPSARTGTASAIVANASAVTMVAASGSVTADAGVSTSAMDPVNNQAGVGGGVGGEPDPASITGAEYKRLFSAALSYPSTARRTGKAGSVALVVMIDADGVIRSAEVGSSSGSALLDAAALGAAGAIAAVPAPGRPLRLVIRAVFSAGMTSLEP